MARMTTKLFYFSNQAYLDYKYLSKDIDDYIDDSNYFNALTGFPWCGGKIWFILLFEYCFNSLYTLIESLELNDHSIIEINLEIETKFIQLAEFGFPILISSINASVSAFVYISAKEAVPYTTTQI